MRSSNSDIFKSESEFELRMLFVRLFRILAAPQLIRTVTIKTKQPHDTQVPEGGLRAETWSFRVPIHPINNPSNQSIHPSNQSTNHSQQSIHPINPNACWSETCLSQNGAQTSLRNTVPTVTCPNYPHCQDKTPVHFQFLTFEGLREG